MIRGLEASRQNKTHGITGDYHRGDILVIGVDIFSLGFLVEVEGS